ncbi:prolyl oligopeptidase family serine peptidase [Flavihumibacter cheonanensis]|uniref:prolyl oligopeptidase family serine peptidase n=1 Tax=Flavihumibacter cheonanensis TaxID=1442385 RepID=UPI001EF969AB|nr:prolyl oligopeptidase family serine peptidase [Flavihumibacter cheonanensis]MCG7752570.1 prolyl oligopeptidase family serine peptidase [Flavihumibacter cheonanensis]
MRCYLLLLVLLPFYRLTAQLVYPKAKTEKFDTTVMGIRISDPYFWMERKDREAEMMQFCKLQGEFADAALNKVPGLSLLEKEINDAYSGLQSEIWNLQSIGDNFYYYRDTEDKGPTLCRRKGVTGEEERILNRVIINGQRYSIRKRLFANKRPLLAVMLTRNGENDPHIRIYHLDLKEFLADSIGPVMFNDSRGVSMAWAPDDTGIFYTQAPPTTIQAEKYFNGKIKFHKVGTDPSKDVALFGSGLNPDISLKAGETPYVYSFPNSPYIIARVRSGSDDNYAFAVHISKLQGATTPWVRLQNYINLGDGFDANGEWLYAVTTGHPNYRMVRINMKTGKEPEALLPPFELPIAGTDVQYNKAIIAGKDFLYILLRQIGNMQIVQVDLKTRKTKLLPINDKVSISQLFLRNENDLVFCQSSPVKSDEYKIYNAGKNELTGLPFTAKSLDKTRELKTEVWMVPSRDGKKIPVSLVYGDSIKKPFSNRSFLIEGYGNSGASNDLYFNPQFLPWLNRGGIYAYAHVRGGGELGDDWYKDGQYPNKMNSINDMVDVADFLMTNNYSKPGGIVVMAGSAGSFLVGNSLNQRPDLFAGGIFLAGLPDLALHTDAAGAREEKSVGPKNTPEGFRSNYEISAIHHIPTGKSLPGLLIVHGATDYILSLSPVARYAARYQDSQAGHRPVLLRVQWEGGHLGGAGEIFDILRFALWQTGDPEFQPKE